MIIHLTGSGCGSRATCHTYFEDEVTCDVCRALVASKSRSAPNAGADPRPEGVGTEEAKSASLSRRDLALQLLGLLDAEIAALKARLREREVHREWLKAFEETL